MSTYYKFLIEAIRKKQLKRDAALWPKTEEELDSFLLANQNLPNPGHEERVAKVLSMIAFDGLVELTDVDPRTAHRRSRCWIGPAHPDDRIIIDPEEISSISRINEVDLGPGGTAYGNFTQVVVDGVTFIVSETIEQILGGHRPRIAAKG